jgi:PAS domain S-box-containing protein
MTSITAQNKHPFQQLLQSNSPGCVIDQSGKFLEANLLFCNLIEHDWQHFQNTSFFDFLHPDFVKIFEASAWENIENGRVWKGELCLSIPSQRQLFIEATIVPLQSNSNTQQHFLILPSEIHSRQLGDEDLSLTLRSLLDYKFAFDQSYLLALTDKNGVLLDVNENFCKLSGYTKAELIGQNHRIINSPNQSKAEIQHLWQTISKGLKWKGEFQNISKNGRLYWVESTIVPMPTKVANNYQYLAISNDITSRKEADETERGQQSKLKKNNRESSILLQRINEGFAMFDRNFRFTNVNAVMCELTKKSREELRDQILWDVFPFVRTSPIGQMMIDTVNDGEFRQHTEFFPELNRWLENNLYATEEGLSVFIRDITEQKKLELETQKNEKIYKTIASNIPGMQICLLNEKLELLLIEGDLSEKMGLDTSKVIGLPIDTILGADTKAEIITQLRKGFEGITFTSERAARGFHLQYRIVPLFNAEKNVDSVMMVILDITNLTTAKQQVEELNTQLERKVEIRTLELESANRELESFSYSVAHDLRTPLRAMSAYSSMLKEEYQSQLPGEGGRYVNELIYNTEKMGQLIDDLLTLSRLGRKELRFSEVDMTQLTQSVLQEMRLSPEQIKNIKLGPLASVQGDWSLLKQVMINLLSNAIKYSSKKAQIAISISCEGTSDGTTFCIEDQGAGFDMNYAQNLFGVFQRLHPEEEFEGTGVGLAIVSRIILRHHGKVWATGETNVGAKFYFYIPNSSQNV